MTLSNLFSRLVSSRHGRSTGRGRNPSRAHLAIEPLDDRLLPSVLSFLSAGQNMYEGDSVQSPNALFRIFLTRKGDLVETASPDFVWDAHTSGTPDSYVRLQLDGNLVFHGGLGNVGGISGTQGHPGDVLRVQDDGNVVIYQSGNPLWSTQTAGFEERLYLTHRPTGRRQLKSPAPAGGAALSKNIIKRIASEGRKFGVGFAIVSQRPSKLDADMTSQCNTLIVMRLKNPDD